MYYTQGDEKHQLTFKRKVLLEIHGPIRSPNGDYGSRKNENLIIL